MSRSRRARLPITATLISLAWPRPPCSARPPRRPPRSPHGMRKPQPRSARWRRRRQRPPPIPSPSWSSPRPPASGTTRSRPASPPSSSSARPTASRSTPPRTPPRSPTPTWPGTRPSSSSPPPATCSTPPSRRAFERYIRGRRRLRRRARRLRHRVRLALVRRPGRRVLHQPPGEPARPRSRSRTAAHPSTAGLPALWTRSTSGTTSGPTRAATCTCWPAWTRRSYAPGAGAMGADHPIAWCQDYDGGRSWYTGAGPHQRVVRRAGVPAAPARRHPDRGRRRRRRLRRVADRQLREGHAGQQHQQPDGAGHRPGRAGLLHRARRPGADRQAGHRHHRRPRSTWTSSPATRTACSASRSTRTSPPTTGSTSTTRRTTASTAQPARPGSRSTGDTIDLASEKVRAARSPTQRNTCCHAGGSMAFDGDGNLYLATGDNTNPFESDGVHADRRAGRPRRLRRAAHRRQHQRPARQDPADPPGRTTAPTPSRRATSSPPGTAQTRPEIYAMGFRNPFRIGIDPKTNTLYVADYGPDAGAGEPEPRARRARSSGTSSSSPATTAGRTARATTTPYNDYTFATGADGREVQLRRAGQQLAQQHRPDQPAAGRARPPSTTTTPATRCSRRSAAAARRWAARSTATTPTSTPTEVAGYYDGKALFGEWNQNKMYTFQVDADGTVAGRHQPAADRR